MAKFVEDFPNIIKLFPNHSTTDNDNEGESNMQISKKCRSAKLEKTKLSAQENICKNSTSKYLTNKYSS